MNDSIPKCPKCGAPMTDLGQLAFSLDPNDPDGTVWICRSQACERRRDEEFDAIFPPP